MLSTSVAAILEFSQSINQSINLYRAIVQRRVLQCGYAESKRKCLETDLKCVNGWSSSIPYSCLIKKKTRQVFCHDSLQHERKIYFVDIVVSWDFFCAAAHWSDFFLLYTVQFHWSYQCCWWIKLISLLYICVIIIIIIIIIIIVFRHCANSVWMCMSDC